MRTDDHLNSGYVKSEVSAGQMSGMCIRQLEIWSQVRPNIAEGWCFVSCDVIQNRFPMKNEFKWPLRNCLKSFLKWSVSFHLKHFTVNKVSSLPLTKHAEAPGDTDSPRPSRTRRSDAGSRGQKPSRAWEGLAGRVGL